MQFFCIFLTTGGAVSELLPSASIRNDGECLCFPGEHGTVLTGVAASSAIEASSSVGDCSATLLSSDRVKRRLRDSLKIALLDMGNCVVA